MKSINPETRAKIVDLYAHGKLHREIRDETGVSMGSISKICREAGLDKYHTGGRITRAIPAIPDLPAPKEPTVEPLTITSRTLTMRGITGCEYIAGTNMATIDITLGDWALSMEAKKLNQFIAELQSVKKMVGIA